MWSVEAQNLGPGSQPRSTFTPWGLGALSGVPGPAAQTGRGFVRKAESTESESAFSPAPRGFVHRLRLEEHRDETLYKSYDSTVPQFPHL